MFCPMSTVGTGLTQYINFYFLTELNVARQFVCPGIPDELVSSNSG